MIEKEYRDYECEFNYEFLIYRLKNNNYFLFQKIKEDMTGYKIQFECRGCVGYPKTFCLKRIKKLSGNRFMSISNYGIKIYALNSNENYIVVLLDDHKMAIEDICEIEENNFIFRSSQYIRGEFSPQSYNYLKIEKVCLRNISTKEIISKQKDLEFDGYHREGIDKTEEQILSSLKLTSNFQLLMEYPNDDEEIEKNKKNGFDYSFSDFVVLKKKYFLIMKDNILLMFDLSTRKQLKRYSIIEQENTNSDKTYYEIRKWNENEFFIKKDGNITLFNLDDSKEIELQFIAYSFFPNLTNIIKMHDENRFYSKEKDHIIIY